MFLRKLFLVFDPPPPLSRLLIFFFPETLSKIESFEELTKNSFFRDKFLLEKTFFLSTEFSPANDSQSAYIQNNFCDQEIGKKRTQRKSTNKPTFTTNLTLFDL